MSVPAPMQPNPNGVLAKGPSKDRTCENPVVRRQGSRTGVANVSVPIV